MEAKLEKLESQKALISKTLAKSKPKQKDFDASFRTAMNFLANPWKLWESGRADDCQILLKLTIANPIPYVRNRGFRTAKTTLPFKVLDDLDSEGEVVAEGMGLKSNLLRVVIY